MKNVPVLYGVLVWVIGVGFLGEEVAGQDRPLGGFASNIVMPQARVFAPRHAQVVQITGVEVGVSIVEQVATTTMDVSLLNPTGRRLEAEVLMPVPGGAVLRGFTFQGAGSEPTAELLPADRARHIYDSIVAQVRDPALLEFAGYNLIRSSVFPVEPGGTQKVRLIYEHVLRSDGGHVEYVLPRSESVDYHVPWKVSVRIGSKRAVSAVYSPSHRIHTRRESEGWDGGKVVVRQAGAALEQPGAFRLSYLLGGEGVNATLLAYPDAKIGGGYFLLLAGLPEDAQDKNAHRSIRREVTLVLDRSGSMNGPKLRQALDAARQILAGLDDGEYFNLMVYNEAVDVFAHAPVPKTPETMRAARQYLSGIKARGGTNIHDALGEALRQKPSPDTLPIVLFLTDGLPTIGQTSERAIRELAAKGNAHQRRVFTFGVGADVNSPLLENLAYQTRAASTFVLPDEDVEVKVAGVFRRLGAPVLAYPSLRTVGAGITGVGRVRDLMPHQLPDLFDGDQLVLLGRYVGNAPLTFELSGNYLGRTRSFRFDFDLDRASLRNAFVPRLWASRKIGVLIDAIRASGADAHTVPNTYDPGLRELVDEIVRLSTEFGILTEYTAFLAREGTDLGREGDVLNEAVMNFSRRAIDVRSGLGSINQDSNQIVQKSGSVLNRRNSYVDEKMKRVSVSNVQQVSDMAFYRKSGRWVDSRLVGNPKQAGASRVVVFGSPEHRVLTQRLARQNRQGALALDADTLLLVDGETVLVQSPREN